METQSTIKDKKPKVDKEALELIKAAKDKAVKTQQIIKKNEAIHTNKK